jgi:pyrophosphatase PpaX
MNAMSVANGILLDLDGTLVISAELEPLRRQRRWPAVYQNLHRTRLPPDTPAFLTAIQALGRVGIVTSAPRSYAERLVQYHRLSVPVLVAYHDAQHHKPDPEPIRLAVRRLGVPVERSVYIGDTDADLQAACAAGVAAIGVSWGAAIAEPELAVAVRSSWWEVVDVVAKLFSQKGGV